MAGCGNPASHKDTAAAPPTEPECGRTSFLCKVYTLVSVLYCIIWVITESVNERCRRAWYYYSVEKSCVQCSMCVFTPPGGSRIVPTGTGGLHCQDAGRPPPPHCQLSLLPTFTFPVSKQLAQLSYFQHKHLQSSPLLTKLLYILQAHSWEVWGRHVLEAGWKKWADYSVWEG